MELHTKTYYDNSFYYKQQLYLPLEWVFLLVCLAAQFFSQRSRDVCGGILKHGKTWKTFQQYSIKNFQLITRIKTHLDRFFQQEDPILQSDDSNSAKYIHLYTFHLSFI